MAPPAGICDTALSPRNGGSACACGVSATCAEISEISRDTSVRTSVGPVRAAASTTGAAGARSA
ncbi:hypothetical protein [Marinovum sp. B10]|uniref:hypothetical protein n=1 Tax=Marinovum sp. B10 TaxID=3449224 RepID=UPI003EDC588C